MANNINKNNNNVGQQRKQWPKHHQQLGPDNSMEHPYRRAIWNYSSKNPKTHLTTNVGAQKRQNLRPKNNIKVVGAQKQHKYWPKNSMKQQ